MHNSQREPATRENKVITTSVIRPLDDPTWCAQSVVGDLRTNGLGYVGVRVGPIRQPANGFLPIDTYGLSFTVFELFSWLKKRFCPPARIRCKYCSKSYRFVEQQNWGIQTVDWQCDLVMSTSLHNLATYINGLKVQWKCCSHRNSFILTMTNQNLLNIWDKNSRKKINI